MGRFMFFELVDKHFDYLFGDYGFAMVAQEYHPELNDTAWIKMQSGNCGVEIVLERWQVLIRVGSLSVPEGGLSDLGNLWFSLPIITAFLTQGKDKWWKDHSPFDFGYLDPDARLDRQIARLADKMRPYCDQVFELFQVETFRRQQAELVEFRRQVAEERWGKPMGK